jgi:hypothetical protein
MVLPQARGAISAAAPYSLVWDPFKCLCHKIKLDTVGEDCLRAGMEAHIIHYRRIVNGR